MTILDINNGKADRTETFITERTLKMMRHIFEEKFSKVVFMVSKKSFGFTSCHEQSSANFVRLGWKLSCKYLGSYLRVRFEFFQKSHFLFNKKIRKRLLPEPGVWSSEPYKSWWEHQKLKRSKSSRVKISARSDEFKGRLSEVQSCDLDEILVFENNGK